MENPDIKVYLTVTGYVPAAKLVPYIFLDLIVIWLELGSIVT